MGYARLLKRYTEKENNVVYTFAVAHLSQEILDSIDEKSRAEQEVHFQKTGAVPYAAPARICLRRPEIKTGSRSTRRKSYGRK